MELLKLARRQVEGTIHLSFVLRDKLNSNPRQDVLSKPSAPAQIKLVGGPQPIKILDNVGIIDQSETSGIGKQPRQRLSWLVKLVVLSAMAEAP